MDLDLGKKNAEIFPAPLEDFVSAAPSLLCDCDCLNIVNARKKKKKSDLKQRRPTLPGNIERGCLSEVLTEPFMPMQTSHGLDRVPSTKHVNHPSVKKGEIRE